LQIRNIGDREGDKTTHMSLKLLQEKIGVKPDGSFGKMTLQAAARHFKITNLQAVHFFAQCAHETGGFKVFEENLNYSKPGLLKVFGKYFTEETAEKYAHSPERIANRVYANRMGNGDEASGDGWKFRGSGAIQTTGRTNFLRFFQSIGRPDLISQPELLRGSYAFDSAKFFFDDNKLWKICDLGTDDNVVKLLTKRVNGGAHGLQDRIRLTRLYSVYI
jgi:putative chitinase